MKNRNYDFERICAEEELIASAQAVIAELMALRQVSQKELAQRLGVSEAAISKMLGLAPGNLTLRRFARVVHALGDEAILTSQELEARKIIGSAMRHLERKGMIWEGLPSPEPLFSHANENDYEPAGPVSIDYQVPRSIGRVRVAA